MYTLAEYVDAVRMLYKATGAASTPKQLRAIRTIHDTYEPKVLRVVQSVLKTARTRFRRKLSVDKLADLLADVRKADNDDVKAALAKILDVAFAGSAADFVDIESEMVAELAKQFTTVYQVQLNFKLVNEKAVEYLTDHAENYFSTLPDDLAEGLLRVAGDVLASDTQYTIRDVARGIRDAFLNTEMYMPNQTIGTTDWAMISARSETARAASYAQRSALESLDLKTWMWNSEDSACDICDPNDGQIVAIGEDFPSGDSEPPAHPNCRCVTTAVIDELTSLGDDDTPDDEQPTE